MSLQSQSEAHLPVLKPDSCLADTKVYPGMIVGEHAKENDLDVNPCKMKGDQ